MDDDDYDSDSIDELLIHLEGDARPFVEVEILNKKLIGLLNSGAQKTVLGKGSENLIKHLRLKVFQTSTIAKTASGTPIRIQGYVNWPITFNGETHIVPALIAPEVRHRLILGYEDFWRVFNLEPTVQNRRVSYENSLDSDIEVDEISEDSLSQEQLDKGNVQGGSGREKAQSHSDDILQNRNKGGIQKFSPGKNKPLPYFSRAPV